VTRVFQGKVAAADCLANAGIILFVERYAMELKKISPWRDATPEI